MIDINELRRLAQDQEWIGRWYDAGCETLMAERNGEHEEVAHPYPIGLVPYLVAVQPTAVSELLDRLEAAEKERDEFKRACFGHISDNSMLRAKVEQMEKQEPVAFAHWSANGFSEDPEKLVVTHEPPDSHSRRMARWFPLYALPGAQPAPSTPDDVMRDAKRYRFLRAAKNIPISSKAARDPVVYDEAIDAAMLAAAPEAKPCP